jgi:hypothetical protein
MTLRLDLTDQDFFRDPAARIAELRALASRGSLSLLTLSKLVSNEQYRPVSAPG